MMPRAMSSQSEGEMPAIRETDDAWKRARKTSERTPVSTRCQGTSMQRAERATATYRVVLSRTIDREKPANAFVDPVEKASWDRPDE